MTPLSGESPLRPKWKNLELFLNKCAEKHIRKHLLELDPHTHLFDLVPTLGLPELLSAYLLYNISLDDDDDDDSRTDDENDDNIRPAVYFPPPPPSSSSFSDYVEEDDDDSADDDDCDDGDHDGGDN